MSVRTSAFQPARVVVTGMAAITSLGDSFADIEAALRAGRSGIRQMPEWAQLKDLNTRLGAPVPDFKMPAHYSRKHLRSMGRVAQMSVLSAERALQDAGLLDAARQPAAVLTDGRTGISYGHSGGSAEPVIAFGRLLAGEGSSGINSASYLQMMTHTGAVNIGVHFGIKGRIVPTSSACTSGSQGLGYAYEAIRFRKQTVMIAGGAEEQSGMEAVVFDTLFATSQKNDTPQLTPRPFDRDRDGLVCGEGACTLILEEREHALARGANILGEIIGFACNSDGLHVTQPERATMAEVMRLALTDAGVTAQDIGYVNAHGTATERGDIAESHATHEVFGSQVPVSSLKGHFGHTLGACGALEAALTLRMLQQGWLAPTLNLQNVDERCAPLDYLQGEGRAATVEMAVSNNFAFGGINTSLVLRRETR